MKKLVKLVELVEKAIKYKSDSHIICQNCKSVINARDIFRESGYEITKVRRRGVSYRPIYMPSSENKVDKDMPLFKTENEAWAFIDGLNWDCKLSEDEHPCSNCRAEWDVEEIVN